MALSSGILFGIMAMLGWGLADFTVVNAVRKTSVIKALIWGQVISAAAYVIITLLFFDIPALPVKTILLSLAAGMLGAIASFTFYKGLQVGKVAVVAPIMACWVIVTVILSLFFLKETLTGIQAVAVSLAIAGVLLISFKGRDLGQLNVGNFALGAEFAVISALCWGIYFILLDILVSDLGWFIPTVLTRIASALFLLMFVAAKKENISFPNNVKGWILADAFFNLAAFVSYGAAISSKNTALVAPIISVTPAVTVILAFIFFREKIELNQKIGMVAALSGIVLLSL